MVIYLWATRTVPPEGSGSGVAVSATTSEERVVVVVVVAAASSATRLALRLRVVVVVFGMEQVPAKIGDSRTTLVGVSFVVVVMVVVLG